jgi:hypothetical protein
MRKHNGGNWADFRPLSNVMVRPSHFYATKIINDQWAIVVVALLTHQVAQIQRLTSTKEGKYFKWSGLYGATML